MWAILRREVRDVLVRFELFISFVLGNWAAPSGGYQRTLLPVYAGNERERPLYMAGVALELRIEGCLDGVSLPEYRSRDTGIGMWWILISGAGRRRFPSPHWWESPRLCYLGRSVFETGNRSGRSNHLEI
jgi:hypothetical protein